MTIGTLHLHPEKELLPNLLADTWANENLLTLLGSISKFDLNPEQVKANFVMAATLDLEMTKSLRSVNQLVAALAHEKEQPDIVTASKPETLIENLKRFSPQLGEELELIRKDQLENYQGMTQLFSDVATGKRPKPKHPGSKKAVSDEDIPAVDVYYQNYHCFKRHTDNVENVPAAYYEPGQAIALSMQRGGRDAAMAA